MNGEQLLASYLRMMLKQIFSSLPEVKGLPAAFAAHHAQILRLKPEAQSALRNICTEFRGLDVEECLLAIGAA